jgi:glycosyltransferase involved in cell wall biosynthesis
MKISIVVPTFREEENIEAHYNACMEALASIDCRDIEAPDYEYLVIDNCSPDKTVEIALRLRESDPKVKILVNDRNYGAVLSPFHGLMSATGDAVLLIAADLQEPPQLLPEFLQAYAAGYEAAIGYKQSARENLVMWKFRGIYYKLLNTLISSGVPPRFSGFGLYSRSLLERLRDDYHLEPSLRILLPLHATKIKAIAYQHLQRQHGSSSYSFYGYLREAVKTIARSSSKFPSFAGKIASLLAMLAILVIPVTIILKIMYWEIFSPGIATLIVITLTINSFIFAFLAIILDRMNQLLSRLPPPRREVRQSAQYL